MAAPRPLTGQHLRPRRGAAIARCAFTAACRGRRKTAAPGALPAQREAGVVGSNDTLTRADEWVRQRLESLPVRRYTRRPRACSRAVAGRPTGADTSERGSAGTRSISNGSRMASCGSETLDRIPPPTRCGRCYARGRSPAAAMPFDCSAISRCVRAPARHSARATSAICRPRVGAQRAAWAGPLRPIRDAERWLDGCVRASSLLGADRCEVHSERLAGAFPTWRCARPASGEAFVQIRTARCCCVAARDSAR
jgi:hypothetical protein